MQRRLLLASLLAAPPALAQHHRHAGPAPGAAECGDAALSCASTATPAFGADGRLHLAWSAGGTVMYASSTDRGASFGPAVPVSPAATPIDDNGEARPKPVPLADGEVLVTWTVRRDAAYDGSVMLARSSHGGRQFEPPRPLLAEGAASQRFEQLGVGPDGRLWAFWLDKRRVAAARAHGQRLAGAALAMAWSEDGGRRFGESRLIAEPSCECCRLGLAFAANGLPVLAWRHIFGRNFRDHALGQVAADGSLASLTRISADDWAIDACPHHGPALALDGSGRAHAAWYSGGGRRRGVFYARAAAPGEAFGAPRPVGDVARAPGHPQLLALGEAVLLAWKEFDGEITRIMAMDSADAGASWGAPRILAATGEESDHPLLIAHAGSAFLSWQTRQQGYRLMPVSIGGRA